MFIVLAGDYSLISINVKNHKGTGGLARPNNLYSDKSVFFLWVILTRSLCVDLTAMNGGDSSSIYYY